MTTSVPGVVTETFNGLTTGNYTTLAFNGNSSLGTYSASAGGVFRIEPQDPFGGATDPSVKKNESRYFVFGQQTGTSIPVDLSLPTPYNYFGFWWSAGDANNAVSFYSGTELLAYIKAADITALLNSRATVYSIGGTPYATGDYFGDPAKGNTGANSAQPYSYIDVIFSAGTFDTVRFDNSGSTGTGFETDNHALAVLTTFIPPASDVWLESNVPEPADIALIFSGCVLIALGIVRRKSGRSTKLRHNETHAHISFVLAGVREFVRRRWRSIR